VPVSIEYSSDSVSPCGVHATAGNVRRAAQGVSNQCTDLQMLGIELWGSYAEFVLCSCDNLYPLPDKIDMAEAAALAATVRWRSHSCTRP